METEGFDIWNHTPRKIKCVRSDNNVWKGGGDRNHELTVDQEYDLEEHEVFSDYTLVKVKGIDTWFNSVLFDEVDGYKYVEDSEEMRRWNYIPDHDEDIED